MHTFALRVSNTKDMHRWGGIKATDLILITRRMPPIIPGTGALHQYAETPNFGCRAIMTYDPRTMYQRFGFNVLAGVALV